MSSWEKLTNFIGSHRAAVLIGFTVVISSSAGVYYYFSTVDSSLKLDQKPEKQSGKEKSEKKNTGNKKSTKQSAPARSSQLPASVSLVSVPTKTALCGFPLIIEPFTGIGYPDIPKGSNLEHLSTKDLQAIANQFKQVGNSFYGSEKYKDGLNFYTKAINVFNDPIYYSNRAACYFALEQYDKVISDTTAALEIKPDYMKCILRRSIAHEKLSQLEDALLDASCAYILSNREDATLDATMERLIRERSSEITSEIIKNRKPKLQSVSVCASFINSVCSLADFPEFLDISEPNSSEYDIRLALEALKMDSLVSYEQALDLFNKAIKKGGEHKYYALGFRSVLRYLSSDNDGARKDALESIDIKPTATAYIVNSSIEIQRSNISGASIELERAAAVEPDSPFVALHRGQLYFMLGDFDNGMEYCQKAVEINPLLVMAHIQIAIALYRFGKADKAHEKFKVLSTKFPKDYRVYLYEGEVYVDQGEFDKAEACFDRAAKLNNATIGEMNVHPLVNKALIYAQKGKIREAIKLVRKATTLDPKSNLAWSTLYQMYMKIQDSDNTTKAINKAIETSMSPDAVQEHVSALVALRSQIRLKTERTFYFKKMSLNRRP